MAIPEPALPDEATLRRWIAACDPKEPIGPDDPRYFDFDTVEVDGEPVSLRGEDIINGLFDAITLSDHRSCQLFSGFSGTGKSTELRRLTCKLEDEGYAVLLVDAQSYHDLNHPLAIADLLVVIAGAFGEAVSKRLGEDVLGVSYWQRFFDFLRQDVELQELGISTGVIDLKVGLRHSAPFWQQVNAALTTSLGKLKEHSHQFIQHCVAAVKRKEPHARGVVFILDSLERLTAPVTQFRQVMESVVRVFAQYAEFLRLPDCHVIYTLPPYVQLISPALKNRYDHASLVLPALKVQERDGSKPYRPGIAALTQLIEQRIPLDEVFGNRRDLLEKLIIYSGGHVRMLIVFVRELLFRARRRGLPPSAEEIERVVQPFREEAGTAIWWEGVPLLARVQEKGTMEGLREEEYPFLAHFMDNYVVLCYRNGDGWYEIHPLARDVLSRLVARRREADQRKNGTSIRAPGEGDSTA